MPRGKANTDGISPALKAVGVFNIQKKGNQAELFIDPSKLPEKARKAIAPGFAAAGGSNLYSNPFDASYFTKPYDVLNANPHEKIRMSMLYFQSDPLVGKIIELMKTFSKEGFKNECADPEIKKWFDNWADLVDLDMVLGWMFLEYYRSGNVVTARRLMTYREDLFDLAAPEYAYGSKEEELEKAVAAKKKMYSKKSIPIAYTVLNPLTVSVLNVNGYKDDLYLNTKQTVKLNSENDSYELLTKEMPGDLGEIAKKAGMVPLSDNNVRRVLRMRQPYEAYGSVLMERAFNALYEKNKLRQMDMSMVNSSINQIVKVTVGNDDYPATKAAMNNVAKAFQNAGKGNAIFWNHTLNIEVIRPDTTVLNNQKYERVNEDIRNAFGISEILTGGGSAKQNFATAYLSLKAFMANLTEGRDDILRWLLGEYKDIARAMGFKTYPTPSFNPLSMTDEIAEKQLIMQAVDRGIISYESAQSRLGYDPRIELDRRRKEKPDVDDGILGFLGNPVQLAQLQNEAVDTDEENTKKIKKDSKKDVDDKDKAADQRNRNNNKAGSPQGIPGGGEGRPKGEKGNYKKNRKTAKIKGQGSEVNLG